MFVRRGPIVLSCLLLLLPVGGFMLSLGFMMLWFVACLAMAWQIFAV